MGQMNVSNRCLIDNRNASTFFPNENPSNLIQKQNNENIIQINTFSHRASVALITQSDCAPQL